MGQGGPTACVNPKIKVTAPTKTALIQLTVRSNFWFGFWYGRWGVRDVSVHGRGDPRRDLERGGNFVLLNEAVALAARHLIGYFYFSGGVNEGLMAHGLTLWSPQSEAQLAHGRISSSSASTNLSSVIGSSCASG